MTAPALRGEWNGSCAGESLRQSKYAELSLEADALRRAVDQENAAWWISHDGKRRLRAVEPHQGDYEPPEVDDWRPGDHRPKAKEE